MWGMYTYIMEYYSDIKKNKIMPFAPTWMDLEVITENEAKWRKTNTIYYYLYVASNIYIYTHTHTYTVLYKMEIDTRPQKTNLRLPKK